MLPHPQSNVTYLRGALLNVLLCILMSMALSMFAVTQRGPYSGFPLFIPQRKQPVAALTTQPDGSIQLHKSVQDDAHMMSVAFDAIGFDTALFARAVELGATSIKVVGRPSQRVYRTDVATFQRYAFAKDFRYGEQSFLKLRYWSINGALPEASQPLPAPKAPEPDGVHIRFVV